MAKKFAGDEKVGFSLFSPLEKKIVDHFVSCIPSWLETNHLTLLTILWSVLVLVFSYLAINNIAWLWLVSLMIVLQYVTDLFDGAVGRYRKTGLIKWGYYMDHFLDYIFLCALLIGYAFILPSTYMYELFFLLAIFGGFMVNSFLAFAASNEFRISHLGIGPTEVRLLFIFVNTLFIIFGQTYLGWTMPLILLLSFFCLCFVVYRTQKELWAVDMRIRK